MSRYSYYGFAPYVPVATRRANARKEMEKMRKAGKVITPVEISGTKIATTYWGKSWCDNLEKYSDFSNRMPRGRTYVRNGSVVHLGISPGVIEAFVAGSSLYQAKITIAALPKAQWDACKKQTSGHITNLLDLLQGKLPKEVLGHIAHPIDGIFPKPKEIKFDCSCPDGASMCKHIAAVLYGIGHRLDREPALFFTLRSVDMQELITAASDQAEAELATAGAALDTDSLADIFGIELDTTATPPATKKVAKKSVAKKAAKKTTKKTASKTAKKAAKKSPAKPLPPPPTKKAAKSPTKKAAKSTTKKAATKAFKSRTKSS